MSDRVLLEIQRFEVLTGKGLEAHWFKIWKNTKLDNYEVEVLGSDDEVIIKKEYKLIEDALKMRKYFIMQFNPGIRNDSSYAKQ